MTSDISWHTELTDNLKAQGFRALIVLSGELSWANHYATKIIAQNKSLNYQIFTETQIQTDESTVTSATYRHHLGTENDLIFFMDPQLNLDALAALSGTLVAGGFLVVYWPFGEFKQAEQLSHFGDYFYQVITHSQHSYLIEQSNESVCVAINPQPFNEQTTLAWPPKKQSVHSLNQDFCLTQDQRMAVDACKKVFSGKANQPLVVTADRGRGKSSALAITCYELISGSDKPLSIVITAPSFSSLTIFFAQLQQCFPQGKLVQQQFVIDGHSIQFLPVDILNQQKLEANLVLVDEAASIPVYLLATLLTAYSRLIFASTVHGYEGAGRGFTIKFAQELTKLAPKWQTCHLTVPIRWAEHDPLEQLIADACLLNANLPDLTHQQIIAVQNSDASNLFVQQLSQKTLTQSPELLEQVIAILVTAHYQTKPSDLKMLLDKDNMRLFALIVEGKVLGVALTLIEGELAQSVIDGIIQGKRRVKDHFLPQALVSFCCQPSAFDYRYLRIMRIAVHPELQSTGLGSQLLAAIKDYGKDNKIDFLGTSFAANAQVLRFWQQNQFVLTRLGVTKDAASGEHSALMLKPLSMASTKLLTELEQEFYQLFLFQLTDCFQDLPIALVQQVLLFIPQHLAEKIASLSGREQDKVHAFAHDRLNFADASVSLQKWLIHHLAMQRHSDLPDGATSEHALAPAIARLLMKRSVQLVCQQYGITGKKALNHYFKELVAK